MNSISRVAILLSFICGWTASALDAEPVFNTPGFVKQATATIEDKLISMTRLAIPGSKIRVTLYRVDRVPMMQALVEASQRGVDVQVVLDGGNKAFRKVTDHAIQVLVSGIQCAPGEKCVKFCASPIKAPLSLLKIKEGYKVGGSCRGLVINHNKLFLFSELSDGSKNIIAQSSANMMEHQLEMYNDLLIIKNDPKLFAGFMNYWNKLKSDNTVLKKAFPTLTSTDSKVKAYFFPRLISGADPIEELLKKVNCRLPNSRIRGAQSAFTRAEVAKQMRRLFDEGCAVDIISRVDPVQKWSGNKGLDDIGDNIYVLPYRGKRPEEQHPNSIHTKIVLIDASIDNSAEKIPVVLTGSHNIDFWSLRANDEVLFEVRDRGLYEQYSDFIDRIVGDAHAGNIPFVPKFIGPRD